MKRYWIKLWLEILNDPKMGQLPDWLWRRAIELFLLAGENGNDGLLPPIENMAWRLRVFEPNKQQLLDSLKMLSKIGLTHETPSGWMIKSQKEFLFPLHPKYKNRRIEWGVVRRVLSAWVFFQDGRICKNCGAVDDLTIDHIIPIRNGGTDNLDNLQVLCRKCNSSKGAK